MGLSKIGGKLVLAVEGESHSPDIKFALGGIPQGMRFSEKKLAEFMGRRSPGQDALSTQRREADEVEFLDGVENGVVTGPVVAGVIRNTDARPGDYGEERTVPRPGHADFPQWIKRGRIPTGGGDNSGRMTVAYCAAGGICKQLLRQMGITVEAKLETVHGKTSGFDKEILKAKENLDSVGGTIVCRIEGMRPGFGGSMFDGIDGAIAKAMFGIPGVKGIEFGDAFEGTKLYGSEYNDAFEVKDGNVVTRTNRHAGVLGGMTSGMPIVFRLAMKPTPTIFKEQDSVDLATMKPAKLKMRGRHDPCIAKRALPVVEAMASFVILDAVLSSPGIDTCICQTLTGRTLEEDVAQLDGQRLFTQIAELRLDLLSPEERKRAGEFSVMAKMPVLLTCRRKSDGGAFEGSEEERLALMAETLRSGKGAFDLVDIEDDVDGKELELAARMKGVLIIRSLHIFDGSHGSIKRLLGKMRKRHPEADVLKIAFKPNGRKEVKELFKDFERRPDFRYVVVAMGEDGIETRIRANELGCQFTYASVGGLESLGHVSPRELVRRGFLAR